ncbi:sigma-54-dependent Fis family transcriptional regulator [Spiribacter pallidus]|uniref:Sigma-54-dependent Fis family transcriptional regulator n=1 Tax=Spiribacter pallidus TaxID=1987936 RepID=A0ABV3TBP7_9GAMM
MDSTPFIDRRDLVAVRNRLLAGEQPTGAADGVAGSWQRSRQFGLAVDRTVSDAVIESGPLNALRQQNERLISFALPELENLYQQIAGTGSAVLLTDVNGVILERQGDAGFHQRSQRVALSPGACWGEQARGTNAIGLAVAEARCASVHGPEHYLECNAFLTCAASPIHAPTGEVLGVLDVSGDQPARQLHSLGLVRMGARMIENRMLEAHFGEALYVHFHARPELLGTLGEGIVVFDDHGRLCALNAVARDYFADVPHGATVEALFQCTLDHLCAHRSEPSMLRTRAGITVCVKTAMAQPSRRVMSSSPPAVDQHSAGQLHAGDPSIEKLADRARRVFHRGIPVLIEGETGTGKELMARFLHDNGPRSDGPLVTVNCAAIPETLAESELFGHVPGAFTGANPKGATGRVRDAHGGTLFLDEIGDMPLALQTRLLRVLQEKTVLPVGGQQPVAVDFAVISATNQDLSQRVEAGEFRADLYYRLCGLRIGLPRLAQRSDREGLITRSLERCDPSASIAPAAWERLLAYHWPGNLREMENVISTAVALREPGHPIALEDLPSAIAKGTGPAGPLAAGEGQSLKAAEAQHMQSVLESHRGNISAAARALGVSRSTLYRRLGSRG